MTSKSGGGFSNGSGFRFGVPSAPSAGDDGFGFVAKAGQYRTWNWMTVSELQLHKMRDGEVSSSPELFGGCGRLPVLYLKIEDSPTVWLLRRLCRPV
jgi:hypothetical protein